MFIEMNARFRAQASAYKLAFTCEACAYWRDDQEACGIFYPHNDHREKTIAHLQEGDRLYFCKMWEPQG